MAETLDPTAGQIPPTDSPATRAADPTAPKIMANANCVLGKRRVARGRVALFAGAAVIIGRVVALPVTIGRHYDVPGASSSDDWASQMIPKMAFANAIVVRQGLEAQGLLADADAHPGRSGRQNVRPSSECVRELLAGLALVVFCACCRIRFPKWAIFPLLFVVWRLEHLGLFAFSFLLGAGRKLAVQKYGGSQASNRLKPMIIGMIAGELPGTVVPPLAGAIRFLITKETPESCRLYMDSER